MMWLSLAACLVVAVLFAVWRLSQPQADTSLSLSRYFFKEFLFRPFGALGLPWHADIIARQRVIVLSWLIALSVLLGTWCLRDAVPIGSTRQALAWSAWVLVSLVPAVKYFYVGPFMEGARYLYLPSVGWSMLLAVFVSSTWTSRRAQRLALSAAFVLVVTGAVGIRLHLRYWQDAAELRDKVLSDLTAASLAADCEPDSVTGAPDALKGAYVFRNGAQEALERASRVNGQVRCALTWSEGNVDVRTSSPPARK